MIIKNMPVLYSIVHKKLNYEKIIDTMNRKQWLFIKIKQKGEPDILVRVPDNATIRDIQMFAKGIETMTRTYIVEREDLNIAN